MQLLLYHQTNSVTISTMLFGSRTFCMVGVVFFVFVYVLLLYLKKKKKKSKNVSLINHGTFLLHFQQLITCNLYSGLKFDSTFLSPWNCLHGWRHSECYSNKNQRTVFLFFISSTKLRWTASLKKKKTWNFSMWTFCLCGFGTEEFQIFYQVLA